MGLYIKTLSKKDQLRKEAESIITNTYSERTLNIYFF